VLLKNKKINFLKLNNIKKNKFLYKLYKKKLKFTEFINPLNYKRKKKRK
jgi:hypothetical protein